MKHTSILFVLLITMLSSPAYLYAQKKKPVAKKLSNTTAKKSPAKPVAKKPVVTKSAVSNLPKRSTPNVVDNSLLFNRSYTLISAVNDTALIKNKEAIVALTNFINGAIYQRAFPGCQILAAKDGKIIFNKSFGTYSYNNALPITDTTLFDIASVTKIMATTLALMKLYDEGKLMLNSNLMAYIPELVNGTDKAYLRIDNLMMHQAGLKSWIPFYKSTLNTNYGGVNYSIYSTKADKRFGIPVANNLFIRNDYPDTVWEAILNSKLENTGRYVYSDLDLMFLQKVVESITKMPLDQYVYQNFYTPLGLKHTMFNPWQKGLAKQCAPTENDMVFRGQVVQGYVHDPGAAMLGGIAGHAGIFSNKTDLAVIMQMLMNGGEYNGKRFFKRETVQLFTGYHSTISRRGYCFDKPEKAVGDGGPAADICNKTTFGHQGFTGTCVWGDPATGIVFIFLSNRVYPNAENGLINKLKVRTLAQDYLYKALGY